MQKIETILILTFGILLVLVVGGVLVAIYLWAKYSTVILILAGIVLVVVLVSVLARSGAIDAVGKIYGTHLQDRRERDKTQLELKSQQKIQQNELALHWQKLRDDTQLRTMELEFQRITAVVEAQVRHLEVERWRAERAAGILAYQTTQALYKDATGEVINLSREPREPMLQAPPPLTVEDLPQAPVFREVLPLLKDGLIPLTWAIDGPKMGTIKDMLSMGLVGRPERGKSTALMYFTCLLLWIGADVWVWDLHGELSALAGLNYFDRFDDIVASVPHLTTELDERDELYRSTKQRTGVGQVKKPLVLIADEVPVLAAREKDQPKSLEHSPMYTLRRFTLEARKWNGFVFLSGQSLPHTVLPTLTRDNLSSRILLECSPNHARQMGLDKRAIDTLLPVLRGAPKGTHIADFSTWSEPQLADIPYTDSDDLRLVLQRRQREQDMGRSGETEPTGPVYSEPPRGRYHESIDADYRVIEDRSPQGLLGATLHNERASSMLSGDLLRVYTAYKMFGSNRREIEKHTGIPRSTVQRHIEKLIELGYLNEAKR